MDRIRSVCLPFDVSDRHHIAIDLLAVTKEYRHYSVTMLRRWSCVMASVSTCLSRRSLTSSSPFMGHYISEHESLDGGSEFQA